MKPTLPLISPRVDARCVALPGRVGVRDVADACRSAALGFLWGAHLGWGKRELARWLVEPYASVVAWSSASRAPSRRPFRPRRIADETIRDLLEDAHAEVTGALRASASWPGDVAFARGMIDAGVVVGVVDSASSIGYAPVDGPYMRLADRVHSLFMADFLTRPGDYDAFTICDACASATFDAAAHATECAVSGPYSVSLRRRAAREFCVQRSITLVGIGRDAAAG